MNLYFLVEGKRTEHRIYPKWIERLCPNLTRKEAAHEVDHDCYCLKSGRGYPSILTEYLGETILELNHHGKFDFLILCVDSDGRPISDVSLEIQEFMEDNKIRIQGYQLKIVVQNISIETWLLGNRKMLQRNPKNAEFRDFLLHYNVAEFDPERMPLIADDGNLSQFHFDYLRLMLAERNVKYTKEHPRAVTDPDYLDQLILRTQETDHLPTLRDFFQFIRKVNS